MLSRVLSDFDGRSFAEAASYLAEFSRSRDLNPSRYSLRFHKPNGHATFMHMDAPYGFVLKRNGNRSIAFLAFDAENDYIIIRQIQGAFGEMEDLKQIRWERMLLRIAVDWTSANSFKQIRVQKAEDNRYWDDYSGKRQERLRMRYDVTAKRSGFRFDESLNCWVLNLEYSEATK